MVLVVVVDGGAELEVVVAAAVVALVVVGGAELEVVSSAATRT
jgi:hypothetical protein